jgi:hypothetical protein
MVGAPGFDPGRLQQSAAPVYKTELHASADAVLVGVAGFEPVTSSFRTKSASRLRYTPEVARCTGLEPVSLAEHRLGMSEAAGSKPAESTMRR